MEKQTSEKWIAEMKRPTRVVTPSGWDRTNFTFSFYQEEITKKEFSKRFKASKSIEITPERDVSKERIIELIDKPSTGGRRQ